MQVHRRSAAALKNDIQITAYCAVGSYIYGHIWMLNLHSMCAAHLGKTQLLFWIPSYCFHLPTCLCYSLFLSSVVCFPFLYETRRLVSSYLLFLSVLPPLSIPCTNSTTPFHSIVSVMLQFVSLSIFADCLLKPSRAVLRYCVLFIYPGLDFGLQ